MKIERTLFNKLVRWKDSRDRKPLILNGVRQCGKTWLLKEFGASEFNDVVYLNFERDAKLSSFFEGSYEPSAILNNLSAYVGRNIMPGSTLLIFDEIQRCPRALNSLKYFCEEAPEYAIASAGSLLGISLASKEGFPVGKVDLLQLTPCTFFEYLKAVNPRICEYIANIPVEPIPEAMADKLGGYLREYLTFGGMPAVVSVFVESHDIEKAEKELANVIVAYESDFSKHIPTKDIPKLYLIWNSIPKQFAKENRKFMFNEVREGARAKDLEDALQWLINASMVLQVKNVETPEIPLKANEDRKRFKLYTSDVGVLRRLAGLTPATLLNNLDIFSDFKGKLAENFVLQQLHALGFNPVSYWTNATGRAEVDFLVQDNDSVIPIETKSGLNLKAQSLHIYREKYHPTIAVRTSMKNLRLDDGLLNVPLYLLSELPRFLHLCY
jgi:predicted AAA+ superfamily ATPase